MQILSGNVVDSDCVPATLEFVVFGASLCATRGCGFPIIRGVQNIHFPHHQYAVS